MKKSKCFIAFLPVILLMVVWKSRAEAYTAIDYYNAGMQYYHAKSYSQAIPYFTYVLNQDPANTRALQGRANCYYYLGQYQQALTDYQQLQSLQPSSQMASFIQNLQAKIGPAVPPAGIPLPDTSSALPGATSPLPGASAALATPNSPASNVNFGFRLESALFLDGLGDFKTSAQTTLRAYQQIQNTDPSLGFSADIPAGYFGGGLEPMVKFGDSFAIGLPFAFLPVGNVSETAQDGNGLSYSNSYNISAFSIGLDGWYFLSLGKDFQISFSAGPLVAPVNVSYQSNSSGSGPTDAQSGSFSTLAFGGKAQLGLDWHLGKAIVISPFVGYQLVNAGSLQGTLTDSQTGSPTTSTAGQLQLVPGPYGNSVLFLANSQTAPTGSRPAQVDLSGLKSGLQVSFFF